MLFQSIIKRRVKFAIYHNHHPNLTPTSMEIGSMILLFSCVLFLLLSSCATLDTISTNQVFRDGDTIVSDDNMFELGFFSPGKSKNRYLGIWYKKISTGTVVWVANRETPIKDKSGMLELSKQGNLQIRSGDNTVIWSSKSMVFTMSNNTVVVVQLLDTGNLVVWDRTTKDESEIWQSFDHPGNTLLPGMKHGKDLVTGIERVIIPWKSADDPSPGAYLHYLDTNGYPQPFVSQGSVIRWRLGPWNGLKFQGVHMENPNPIYSVQFVFNEEEIYFKYELKASVVQRVLMLPDDITVHLRWMDQTQEWAVHTIRAATDSCGGYGLCGPYASCNANRYPPCKCMAGFEPQVLDEWDRANWSSGCERKRALVCESGSEFKKISGVIFPDTRGSWYNHSMTLEECEKACRTKCNCTAYANSDIRNGGSGCLLWFDELMDTTENDDKQDLYIKLAASELAGTLHLYGFNLILSCYILLTLL
uniref:Putative S-locus glycoprotein domain, Bulb-type lectin domain, PAN/Apple domain protein n=1 Tax=Helianthus annuus TaxID=4232 RepID=A0A251U4V0_HELAN